MRLVDINKVEWKQLNEDMKIRIGWNFNKLETQTTAQVLSMLESIDTKLSQFKNNKHRFETQNNQTFNGLLMAKKILESFLSEANDTHCSDDCCGSDVTAEDCTCAPTCKHCNCNAVNEAAECKYCGGDCPNDEDHACDGYSGDIDGLYESEEVMELDTNRLVLEADAAKMIDRVMANTLEEINSLGKRFRDGGTLHRAILAQGGKFDAKGLNEAFDDVYDEVSVAHYDALSHHNVSEATPMMEDEVGAAESLMAAQDMVDRIQGMLEDVGEMLNEQLLPLTDSLRASSGAEAAGAFNSSATETLNNLLETLRGSRESMANSVASLSGNEPVSMSSAEVPVDDMDDEDVNTDAEVELDDFETSDSAAGGDRELGRTKRD